MPDCHNLVKFLPTLPGYIGFTYLHNTYCFTSTVSISCHQHAALYPHYLKKAAQRAYHQRLAMFFLSLSQYISNIVLSFQAPRCPLICYNVPIVLSGVFEFTTQLHCKTDQAHLYCMQPLPQMISTKYPKSNNYKISQIK